MTSAPGKS